MAQSMTFDATAVVSAELLESVTSRESAKSLPIGVEAAQEAKVEEPCGVSRVHASGRRWRPPWPRLRLRRGCSLRQWRCL